MNIFLDDERWPADVKWVRLPYVDWTVVRCQYDFKMLIETEMPEIISFDHDIHYYDEEGNEVTGYTLLQWLIDYCFENNITIPVCYFHSMNPIGCKNMQTYYDNALKEQ